MPSDEEEMLEAFGAQLMTLFTQQFRKQSQLLKFIQQKLSFIFEPDFTGFLPGEEAALRTQTREMVSGGFGQAREAANERFLTTGGRFAPSGARETVQAMFEAGEFEAQAGGQREITIAGGNRRLGAILQGASILQGNAQIMDPLGFAQTGINALMGDIQANAYHTGNVLANALIGAGTGIGAAAVTRWCWIAEELYGNREPVRSWLQTHASPWFMDWYRVWGERLAWEARMNHRLRFILHCQFDTFMERALCDESKPLLTA